MRRVGVERGLLFFRIFFLIFSAFLIFHGILGSQFAPKNLTTTFVWVHYRGLLVFSLLFFGNFFCMVCPMVFFRNLLRPFFPPRFLWPKSLSRKWPAMVLFIIVLFCYELFDFWGSPFMTALLVLAFFALGTVIDLLFRKATFCKFICPVGQFNFISSTLSPFEVGVKNRDLCISCKGHDCLKGNIGNGRPGCELDLFGPRKVGNMDCTFCLACVSACPTENMGLVLRVPGQELNGDPPRSGIGRFSRRKDISLLIVVFTLGAVLNAFGMVAPVHSLRKRLMGFWGGFAEEWIFLGFLFLLFLVILPAIFLPAASWGTLRAVGERRSVGTIFPTYAYSLLPLGFAVWLGHYGLHLLTGFFTFVPVLQVLLGWEGTFSAQAWWRWGASESTLLRFVIFSLAVGTALSLKVGYSISSRIFPGKAGRAFFPWAVLHLSLGTFALWVLTRPMEMRGAFDP